MNKEFKFKTECSCQLVDADDEYSLLKIIATEINALNSDVEVIQVIISSDKTSALIITKAFNSH